MIEEHARQPLRGLFSLRKSYVGIIRAMHCHDRFRDSFQRLATAAIAFAIVVASGTVFAAGEYIPAGQPVPQNIRWVGDTVSGADTHASAFWRNASGATSHHKFPVPVSSATLGKLAKGAISRGLPVVGWGLTLKGIIDGAGWVIDELGQQVTTPGTPQDQSTTNQYCMYAEYFDGSLSGRRCASSPANAAYPSAPGPTPATFSGMHSSGNAIYTRTDGQGTFLMPITPEPIIEWNPFTENGNPGGAGSEISEYDLGNALKHSPEVVNAILIDPETGAPIRIPELIDALNNLRRGLEAANGLPPGDDLVADTAPGETTTPNETAWPGFCDWATTVCDFIEWVKAPEPETETPEAPWQEEDPSQFTSSWTSGLGGGVCPAPISRSITVGGFSTNIEIPYEPICIGVSYARPVLIALATLLAVFIVGGYRSTKDA